MSDYSLFYNYKALGDVLIINIDPFLDATSYKKDNEVVAIYHDDQVIGYNIYGISKIIKIHYEGLIVSPIIPLLDVINNILKNHKFDTILEEKKPSFIVGKIIDVRNDIYKVDIKNEIVQVKTSNDLALNSCVVVIKPNTMMPNAKINHEYCFATKSMLMLDESDEVLIIDDDKVIGSDFYSGEVKWSN